MTSKFNIYKSHIATVYKRPAANNEFNKSADKILIGQSTSHKLLWCIFSFVFRNSSQSQALKRYRQQTEISQFLTFRLLSSFTYVLIQN